MRAYLLGSCCFVLGSLVFLLTATDPAARLEAAIYMAGSLCFIIGTLSACRKEKK